VFQQVRAHLQNQYPNIRIEGRNFIPPFPRPQLYQLVQLAYMSCIALLLFGNYIFPVLGIPPPQIYYDVQANKLAWVFGIYFVGNTICNSLLSSGAFEVTYQGQVVWSKLAQGRLPNWEELLFSLQRLGVVA